MKLAMPQIAALSSSAIAGLRSGKPIVLKLDEATTLELTLDDILVQRQEKEGLTVANEADITLAIETRLSPELIQEGLAREVVSKLQNIRKESNFSVTDRIRVLYSAPAEIAEAIKAQSAYICNETLAVELAEGTADGMVEVDINDLKASFKVEKA